MTYKGKEFEVQVEKGSIKFTGKMGQAKYAELKEFLYEVDKKTDDKEFNVFLNELRYANSSGIRTIAYFFVKSNKNFYIHIDEQITWQRTVINPIVKMKPQSIVLVK